MNEQTPQSADIDVDALLSQIEGGDATEGTGEIPMTQAEQAAPAQTPQAETPAQQQAIQEFEITWNGKQIKAPVDKIRQWASQGYDYAQKMQELTQQQQLYKQWEEKYKPVDEYIQKDPEWWNHVQQSYQERLNQLQQQTAGQGLDQSHPLMQKISELESKLQHVNQFTEALQQKEEAQRIEQEQQQLDQQIQSIREQYPDLDWAGADTQGKSLEMRVMEHGIKNGIRDFAIAFRDFNHEALMKKAEERGKEQIAKERQRQTKLGLLGTTQAPTKGLRPAEDLKQKSYESLMDEALAELRGAQ